MIQRVRFPAASLTIIDQIPAFSPYLITPSPSPSPHFPPFLSVSSIAITIIKKMSTQMSRNVVEKFVTRIRHLARIECRYFDIRILIIALSIIVPEENRGGQKSI